MSNQDRSWNEASSPSESEPSLYEWIASDEFVAEDLLGEIVEGVEFDGGVESGELDAVAEVSLEDAEQVEHEVAAEQAQTAADAAIEAGDYEAAAELRQDAETEADLSGTSEMLHGADAIDLSAAAERQQEVEQLEWQQSQQAQSGDYEAARDTAFEAEWTQREADSLAGGSDHSGQPQIEQDQMDWAVWNEGIAEDHATNAVEHLENGNTDAAASELELASSHQDMADWHGDLGEHGGSQAIDDPFSETANDHGFDGTYDSGFDAGSSTFDSGLDTSYDTGTDTGTDSYTEY